MTTMPRLDARSWWATGPGVVLALSLLTAIPAWWIIALPVARLANVQAHSDHFALVYAHMVGGTAMLVLGAANLYLGATRRQARLHRWFGRVYLGGGAVAALSAMGMALFVRHGGESPGIAFDLARTTDQGWSLAALALAWLLASAMGWRAALNRRFDSHRAWMIRSYVLAWSFVLCRLVGLVPAIAQLGGGAAMVWLSWILPLLACEIGLQWSAGARLERPAPGRRGDEDRQSEVRLSRMDVSTHG
jgi:hypothetical protein